jgi:hypothetical protein
MGYRERESCYLRCFFSLFYGPCKSRCTAGWAQFGLSNHDAGGRSFLNHQNRLPNIAQSRPQIMNIQHSRGCTILRMSSSLNWKSPGTCAGMGAPHYIKFAGTRKTRVVGTSMDRRVGLFRSCCVRPRDVCPRCTYCIRTVRFAQLAPDPNLDRRRGGESSSPSMPNECRL